MPTVLPVLLLLPQGHIVPRHEAAHERGVPHLDAVEPFDVGNPIPAGSNQAQGKAIGLGQGGAVHLVRQDVVAAHGVSKRHAAGEVLPHLDSPHLLLAGIGAKEDHLLALPRTWASSRIGASGVPAHRALPTAEVNQGKP